MIEVTTTLFRVVENVCKGGRGLKKETATKATTSKQDVDMTIRLIRIIPNPTGNTLTIGVGLASTTKSQKELTEKTNIGKSAALLRGVEVDHLPGLARAPPLPEATMTEMLARANVQVTKNRKLEWKK